MPRGKLWMSLILLVVVLSITVSSISGTSWGSPMQLTFNLTDEDQVSLSSDGNRLAFISNLTNGPEVFVMDPDGKNLRQLTTSRNPSGTKCCPSISGDGSQVVFQSDPQGTSEIFLVNSDGSGLSELTNNRDDDVSPVISTDGSKIAFVSDRDGDPEIFVMNSDGKGVRQLTFNQATDENPSISGDGGLIAFDSNVGVDYEIFVVRSDGTGLKQLTNNLTSEDTFASISWDGSKIVFVSRGPLIAAFQREISRSDVGVQSSSPSILGQSVVMVVNSDGSGLRVLTLNSADNFDASLSGDGRLVAFVSTADGDRDIYTVMSDGSDLTQVTNDQAIDSGPRLNFAGTRLAWVSNLGGDFEVYTSTVSLPAGGGSVPRITRI